MSDGWDRPGVTVEDGATHFRVFAGAAERVELCLFDPRRNEVRRVDLQAQASGLWFTTLAGCTAGQRYGYRAHGPWDPDQGLRYNPAKLLIDPWAMRLDGRLQASHALFDYRRGDHGWQRDDTDSAPFVPLAVTTPEPLVRALRPVRIPWSESIIYEAHVRGFTMRHPELPESERGRFRGLSNGRILDYLKALGITTVELMPVQRFADEPFLARLGLDNFWGYNPLQFFTVTPRYAECDPQAEFVEMVDAIHDAGLEVLLDVVYNHTAEGDARGPTLSFRGLDNLAYYRTEPAEPGRYVNDTGTGNCLDADHPRVWELVLASLVHWHRVMGVDGFRFDLATVLGRTAAGFDPRHPLLAAIESCPDLATARLVAEPWDPGPGGYQLGRFGARWSEWNDRFRDATRRYWRGDGDTLPELARRMSGSPDLFGADRDGTASINLVTSHDGFTLTDLVSYTERHNQANGEDNRDGHGSNFSCNHGVEGATDQAVVQALRRRHRLNLLTTLMLSRGIPMLLAGDEFGNSQGGNNNAWCQDNATGWLDWSGLATDPGFTQAVRRMIAVRRQLRLLRPGDDAVQEQWRDASGHPLGEAGWDRQRAALWWLCDGADEAVIVINGEDRELAFSLPGEGAWSLAFDSALSDSGPVDGRFTAAAWSIACCRRPA